MKARKTWTGGYRVKRYGRLLQLTFRSSSLKSGKAGTVFGTRKKAEAAAKLTGGKVVRA